MCLLKIFDKDDMEITLKSTFCATEYLLLVLLVQQSGVFESESGVFDRLSEERIGVVFGV